MKKHAFILTLLVVLLCVTKLLHAQEPFTAINSPYKQDFNTLISNGSTPWIDNSTLPHWYHARSGTGDALVAGNGSSNLGALYSYGYDADRALGSLGSGNASIGDMWWGVHFVNNTGNTITSLLISYYGEQWRYSGTAAAQTVSFSYQIGSGLNSLISGNWTNAPAFDFISPVIGGVTGARDGNAVAHRVLISDTLSVILLPGQEIMFRWYDPDHPGSDHGLAIDDVSITPLSLPGLTQVGFFLPSSTFTEHAASVEVQLFIINPDMFHATEATVELIGGTASNGVDIRPAYTAQKVIFPAGSRSFQPISFTIHDDSEFEGDETLIFSITSVQGGNNATIGTYATHTVTIIDNDPPPVPSVIVNEVFNAYGNLGTDEAIELYVVKDGADLRGFSIADATSSGTYPYGVLTFSDDPLWSNLPAGTIIVIGGMFAVPITDTDVSDGLLLLQAPVNNTSNTYFSHSRTAISFSASSDAIAIRNSIGNTVHGIAYGTNNLNTLPPGRHAWRHNPLAAVESITFARSGVAMSYTDFLDGAFLTAAPPSLGWPGDTDGNRSFLRTLRSRNITTATTISGTFFWDVTISNNAILTLSGTTNICNTLFIADGRLIENGKGLSADALGNAQNGIGLGDIIVGNGQNEDAVLTLLQNPLHISGNFSATARDASVEFIGSNSYSIYPTDYYNLRLLNGNRHSVKSIDKTITVFGELTIAPDNQLVTSDTVCVILGPRGTFVNQGRFTGSIRSTRTFRGLREDFGGIGFILNNDNKGVKEPVPAKLSVTMTAGSYIWINNRPSILRRYTIASESNFSSQTAMTFKYRESELNMQNEAMLALFHSTDDGSNWKQMSSLTDTAANTVMCISADASGTWSMHANPPQGVIVAFPSSLSYETEQDGPLPASQYIRINNAFADGSMIDWTATTEVLEAAPWMTIIPAIPSGINSGSFQITITRSDLLPGNYTGNIVITDVHAANSPLIIPVQYRVYKAREISIETDTLRIKVTYKRPSVTLRIPVFNSGESFGPGMIAWSASGTTPWLNLVQDRGLENDTLELGFTAHNLTQGSYYGNLTITGSNSITNAAIKNSPLTIAVILEVEAWDYVEENRSNLTMGTSTTFFNNLGQRIATITVTSGTIQTLRLRLNPYALPSNIQRLHYAYRHFIIEATGTYTADLTVCYTLSELAQTGVLTPWHLQLWQQATPRSAWIPCSGYGSHLQQQVTAASVTDLNGVWAPAYPRTVPTTVTLNNINAQWINQNTALLTWSGNAGNFEHDIIVERCNRGSDIWLKAGSVRCLDEQVGHFLDSCVDYHTGMQYRIAVDSGNDRIVQSEPVELLPLQIMGVPDKSTLEITLAQNTPNPVSIHNGHTTISFSLSQAATVSLLIFDLLGRASETEFHQFFEAGTHSFVVDPGSFQPGTYIYQLRTAETAISKKMLITR